MKITRKFFLIFMFLITACTASLPKTPEAVVNQNMEAAKQGDAETRWFLASKAYQEKLLKDSSKEKALEKFRKEVFMYQFVQSWKTQVLSQTEEKATVKIDYKFLDPHSNRVLDQEFKLKLVKEEGHWKIDD